MAAIKKVYPIEDRKDFYKYVIIDEGSIFNDDAIVAKDFKGNEMYFDCITSAQRVCDARNRVKRINKNFLNKTS